MKNPVTIGNINFKLLRKQKNTLLIMANQLEKDKKKKEAIDGIIHLIDHIQDEAEKVYGEKVVYPKF